jgi:hypothetical protein
MRNHGINHRLTRDIRPLAACLLTLETQSLPAFASPILAVATSAPPLAATSTSLRAVTLSGEPIDLAADRGWKVV